MGRCCLRPVSYTHLDVYKRQEERWFRAVSSLAPGAAAGNVDPQRALFLLVADPEGAFSIVKCISGARDNARQVREEISSEMWEHLNRLFHDVTGTVLQPDDDACLLYTSRCV